MESKNDSNNMEEMLLQFRKLLVALRKGKEKAENEEDEKANAMECELKGEGDDRDTCIKNSSLALLWRMIQSVDEIVSAEDTADGSVVAGSQVMHSMMAVIDSCAQFVCRRRTSRLPSPSSPLMGSYPTHDVILRDEETASDGPNRGRIAMVVSSRTDNDSNSSFSGDKLIERWLVFRVFRVASRILRCSPLLPPSVVHFFLSGVGQIVTEITQTRQNQSASVILLDDYYFLLSCYFRLMLEMIRQNSATVSLVAASCDVLLDCLKIFTATTTFAGGISSIEPDARWISIF